LAVLFETDGADGRGISARARFAAASPRQKFKQALNGLTPYIHLQNLVSEPGSHGSFNPPNRHSC
jgi:hypothetical protein